MIKVVLRHADELSVRRVRKLWDERLVEPLFRKCAHRLTELLIQKAERRHSLLPVFGRRRRTGRPILFRRELASISRQSAQHESVVAADVQDKLPNAVCIRDWMAAGLLSRHACQNFQYRTTVPGLTLERSPKLLVQPHQLAGHHAHVSLIGYLFGSYRITTAPEPNSSRLASFKSMSFDRPANNVGPWPASLGCTTNSYSSINPSSANARGNFTPPVNSPLPGSRLSCCTAFPRSPRTSSAFQSTRSRVLDTTYFFAASMVRANGSVQSGIDTVRVASRQAASIIS